MAGRLAVWSELIGTTQTLIQDLGLAYGNPQTVLPPAQVYVFKLPTDRYRLPDNPVLFPCVQVALGGKENLARPEDFENTIIIYPVLVVHCFASNKELALNNDELLWREAIIDQFIDQPRPEVTRAQVFNCTIELAPVLDLRWFQTQNLDVGGVLLNFWTNRLRQR